MSHTAVSPSRQLAKLAWPMYIENLLRIGIASIDVLMLSNFPQAMAGVTISNQYVFFMQLIYSMVAVGATIMVSQHLGAGNKSEAGLYSLGSMVLGSLFAVILSLIMAFSAVPLLGAYNLEPGVFDAASTFLVIIGAGSVFMALGQIQGSVLRAYGYSRDPMFVNIGANIVNILGNFIFIFGVNLGPIHIPALGVTGVAIATVFSQMLACLVMFFRIRKRREILIPFRKMFKLPGQIYRQIMAIGIPTAGENLSYNIGQIVIMGFVSSMGTISITAYGFAITIVRYVFMPSIAIGGGTQITVGKLVGSGNPDIAHSKVYRWWAVGALISLTLVLVVNLAKGPIIHLFTSDPVTVALVSSLLIVSIVLEPGRNFNVIVIPALKAAGDVRFPVLIGMIFVWGIGVTFSWFLGVHLKWGLVGVWIALAVDEWTRGIIMMLRWRSGAWRKKAFVKVDSAEP